MSRWKSDDHRRSSGRPSWFPEGDQAERHSWVISQVTTAIDKGAEASGSFAPVVIGKSLGSLAAPLTAERGLAAVWFTPLMTDEPTVRALRSTPAPLLLVGGTADEFWDGNIARSITPHVVEIQAADHGLFVPGELPHLRPYSVK